MSQQYEISEAFRDKLILQISQLKKENALLVQTSREQKNDMEQDKEELFLELLDIFDALDQILNYLTEVNEITTSLLPRLNRLISSTQKRLLDTLAKQKVRQAEIQEREIDYSICRVVDREVRDDLPEKTITKVLRKGFYYEDRILRPVDVITSVSSASKEIT